jgi:hypothetical protein
MKNKNKSSKVQKQIAVIQQQQAQSGKNKEQLAKEKEKEKKAAEKAAAENRKRMEAQLFASSQPAQKVPFGTDPKSVLCVFFKNGHCEKGTSIFVWEYRDSCVMAQRKEVRERGLSWYALVTRV